MLSPFLLAIATLAAADPAPKPLEIKAYTGKTVSYIKDIADVLEAKCIGCHSSALAENKLNMEELKGMLKGGKRGPSLVPGKADASLLFTMAAHLRNPIMPPRDKKDLKPLTPSELGLLKAWIDAGAKDDSAGTAAVARTIEIGTLPPGIHPINAVDLTADGRRVAAGRANLVQVYDVDSGLEIISLGGHKDLIQSVRYSPDSKLLAAGSYQIVTLWNAPTATQGKTFAGSTDPVKAMLALRDGKTLITASYERSLRVWNLEDGKTIRLVDVNSKTEVMAIAPDEKTLILGDSDGKLRRVNLADGKVIATVPGHAGAVVAIAFAGDRFLTSGKDGQTLVWNAKDAAIGKSTGKLEGLSGKQTTALLVSRDGATVYVARDDGKVQQVTLADMKTKRTFDVSPTAVTCLALSPDEKSLAVGSVDKTTSLIDLATGKVAHRFEPIGAGVADVAFSPDGGWLLAGGSDGGVKIWEVAGKRGLIALSASPAQPGGSAPGFSKVVFTGKKSFVTAGQKLAQAWTIDGGWGEYKTLGGHVFRVLAIDFSPDGKLLATGGGEPSRSGEVKIWEVATGKLIRSLETLHSDTVFALRFSPDGKKLATAAADKFVKVVNVADGKELKSFEGHTNHVLAVDWSADGKKLVSGGADNVLKVWDFESGEQLKTLNPANKQVTSVRWISGKPSVIGGSGDATVKAWNPDNGGVSRTYSGPADYVFAVAASSDGGRIAAGGADGILLLWNGVNGELIRKIAPATEAGSSPKPAK